MFLFPLFSLNSFFSAPRTPAPDPPDQDEEESCSICYHNFSDSDIENRIALACGHVFGTTCIQKWARMSGTCPMCRADVLDTNVLVDHGSEIDALEQPVTLLQDSTELNGHHEDFSWANPVSHWAYGAVNSETESECSEQWSDTCEDFITPAQIDYPPSEDIWIAALHDQQPAFSVKPSFELDEIQSCEFESSVCFEELKSSHEQWMNEVLEDEDGDEDDPIGLFDVFPY